MKRSAEVGHVEYVDVTIHTAASGNQGDGFEGLRKLETGNVQNKKNFRSLHLHIFDLEC